MNQWLPLILLSVLAGVVCGLFIRGRKAVLVGAAVPWLALLGWLLYGEFFLPYQGGGASMWPIAQLFGGTVAALVGALASVGARALRHSA
jgi:hypothetical protein